MRLIAALILFLAVSPALAQGTGVYENARFGYSIVVPDGFEGQGESDNGDGQVFKSADGTQTLRVYGGFNSESFAETIRAGMGYARDAGWNLTYTRVRDTWAVYSGTRARRILYARAIRICGGDAFASYELDYPSADREAMDAVIQDLNASLAASSSGCL
jgi:hypothetical protein